VARAAAKKAIEAATDAGPGAARRRAILKAAVAVFAKKGYHGCRIADVAREAGVAYGLVYHYFENKDELLEQVFAEGWRRFSERLRALLDDERPLAEKVAEIVAFAFDAYDHDPRGMRVLLLEVARSPAFREGGRRTPIEEAIQLTAKLLARAGRRGELAPGTDPLLAACVLFGSIEILLTSLVLGYLDAGRPEDVERAKRTAVQTFLGGVAARGPGGTRGS